MNVFYTIIILFMDNLLLSAIQGIEGENKQLESDIITYNHEINNVLMANGTTPNEVRMLLGKFFIQAVKKEMQHGLVKAGIFGSVSRNEANETSDVDIVLFIQPLTSEEKKIHNNPVLQLERGHGVSYILNSANNSHRIHELEDAFTEKAGIPVRCMIYDYSEKDFDDIQKEIKFITILE